MKKLIFILAFVFFATKSVYAKDIFICKVIEREVCGEIKCTGREKPKKEIRVINLKAKQYVRNEAVFDISEVSLSGAYKIIRINNSFMKILTMDLPLGEKEHLWNKKGYFSEVADKFTSFHLSWGICELD